MIIDREDRAVFSEELQHRRRGRPRSAVVKVWTGVYIPEAVYAALCQRAHVERKSLHAFLCDTLASQVSDAVNDRVLNFSSK